MLEKDATPRGNRLARQTSPYLRQHAGNPVDWYPWGDEALRKARELDRPIFLSIGYSSCHWCHVMERESFEDANIAKFMNEHFINIKVDREERPDLDAVYMTAVQMLTGSGGWPLSVFLTPDLKPFWGGTYFPPESRYGRPGFREILESMADAYRNRRGKLKEAAAELAKYIRKESEARKADKLPGEGPMRENVQHARQTFDAHHGGFGGAPKFPRPIEISKLLRYHHRTGDVDVLHMCETTLQAMARGGIHDQIGGGFHRYSTDERWLVPHFEKMLYDNALLARVYLEAFQTTGNRLYAGVARDVLDYALRDMTEPTGGFCSATDADSEGEEGRFFVWTPQQVEEVLGKSDGRVVCEYYGIREGGNFEHGTSIAHIARSPEEVGKALGLKGSQVADVIGRARPKLLDARNRRPRPFRDEKVITAWNGLMISALARGYQVLEDPRYLEAARKAVRLIFEKLYAGGRLLRTYIGGRANEEIPAFLDDHACLIEGLLDLYEAAFDLEDLGRARDLMDALIAHFRDPAGGGFFYTADHHEALICRRRDDVDGSTPSGNGVAALDLLRLATLTGREAYRKEAEELFKGVSDAMERVAPAFSMTIAALDFLYHPPVEVAVVGDLDSAEARSLLRVVHGRFLPNKVLAATTEPIAPEVAALAPLLRGKTTAGGKPTAYVCRDYACKAPVTSPGDLERQLSTRKPSAAAR